MKKQIVPFNILQLAKTVQSSDSVCRTTVLMKRVPVLAHDDSNEVVGIGVIYEDDTIVAIDGAESIKSITQGFIDDKFYMIEQAEDLEAKEEAIKDLAYLNEKVSRMYEMIAQGDYFNIGLMLESYLFDLKVVNVKNGFEFDSLHFTQKSAVERMEQDSRLEMVKTDYTSKEVGVISKWLLSLDVEGVE